MVFDAGFFGTEGRSNKQSLSKPPHLLKSFQSLIMVVRLRLSRQGTKNNPFYHLVAIADHKPRDARPIEKLGEYDPIPRRNPILPNSLRNHSNNRSSPITSGLPTGFRLEKRLEWDQDRIKHWLKEGAQPSKPVARLLDRVST